MTITPITNLRGPAARIVEVTAETVPADAPAEVIMGGPDQGRTFHFKNPRGLPGVNAVANDTATATYLGSDGSESQAAANRLVAKRLTRVNVRDYGAVGNSDGNAGGTDDTTAIRDAIAAAVALGPDTTLWFPAVPVGYRTTGVLEIPGTLNVLMEAPVVALLAAPGVAVSYNPTGGHVSDRELTFRVRRGAQSNWASEADIGLVLRNVRRSKIVLPRIERFTIGVQVLGAAAGFTGNTVTLGLLLNHKVDIDTETASAGWVNDNLFIGGYASVDSTLHSTLSRIGVRIRSTPGYQNNANVFDKLIVEKGVGITGGAEAICALIIDGIDNEFRMLRNESNTVVLRTQGAAQNNRVEMSYATSHVLDEQGSFPTSVVRSLHRNHIEGPQRPVWSLQDLGRRAVMYDATQINIPGLVLFSTSSATPFRQLNGPTIEAGFLDCKTRQVGVFVATNRAKRFLIQVDAIAGRGGRVFVRCYDAAGALMNPADHTAAPLVKGASGATFGPGAGSDYVTGVDQDTPRFFRVADSVMSIAVGISPGTQSPQLRGITLSTPDLAAPTTWTGFPENEEIALATQAPAGTYTVGRRVNHGAPTVGQPIGWVCTAPTTWRALQNLA